MTAIEHIVAWIESSREHYDRLLQLTEFRKAPSAPAHLSGVHAFESASRLVTDAYREMVRTGACHPLGVRSVSAARVEFTPSIARAMAEQWGGFADTMERIAA